VSAWTGIPVGKMVADQIAPCWTWRSAVAARARPGPRARGDRRAHPDRARQARQPVAAASACSCWSGPSGVGKTETALALADALYGGERNLITINMSEYQEAHTVSSLKGSPPGYVGYGEGGVLTEAVRRRPYSWCCSTRSRRRTRT
jgi:type VI secretion system protein VasG